ncbi:MAG: hypothetical protein ABGY29_01570 [bacterium]
MRQSKAVNVSIEVETAIFPEITLNPRGSKKVKPTTPGQAKTKR